MVYFIFQSASLLVMEYMIQKYQRDPDEETTTHYYSMRIYYSLRYIRIASFCAFLWWECFTKAILTLFVLFQDKYNLAELEVASDDYRTVEKRYYAVSKVVLSLIITACAIGALAFIIVPDKWLD